MKTFFYLHTCSTCQRIIKELNLAGVELKDIKTNKITLLEINEMAKLSGSFESLFSRRAMKYKSLGLASKTLTETDYKNFILEEYTFLKRPVLVLDNEIVIGNSKKSVNEMQTLTK
ncbi:MAG: hypothetical protein JKY42_04610 [Flavobacteriales bacterium]|nr:hypothetical protein [Flavobacteriales bacterium]